MTAISLHTESPISPIADRTEATLFDAESMSDTEETDEYESSTSPTQDLVFKIPEYHSSRQNIPVTAMPARIITNSYIPPHLPTKEIMSSDVTTPATSTSPSSPRSSQPLSTPSSPRTSAPSSRHHSIATASQTNKAPNFVRHYSIATSNPQKVSNLRTSAMNSSPNSRYLPSTVGPFTVRSGAVDLSSPPGYYQNVAESFTDRDSHKRGYSSPSALQMSPFIYEQNSGPFYTNNAFSASNTAYSPRGSVSGSPNRRAGRGLGILDNDPSIYLPAIDENGNITEGSSLTSSLWEAAARWANFAGKRFSAGEKELRRVLGQGVRTGPESGADAGF